MRLCAIVRWMMAAACCVAAISVLAKPGSDAAPSGRLPGGVTPVNYVLDFDIDPHADGFTGRVIIEVDISAPTALIWLHGRDLQLSHAEAQLPNGDVRAATYTQRTSDGVASLAFAQPLPVGRATLRFQYTAQFNKQLAGFYKVRAGGDDYIFSQFEAIDARRAFPCFDEPRFKTPFTVSITAPATSVAVANGAENGTTMSANGQRTVTFASTPSLPTYLVAVAVGPFDVVEGPPLPATSMRDRSVRIRGVAVRGKGALLKQALTVTPALVTRLESYFDQPYPFAKLDIVAVPDFAAGAMENAALITYRDSLILLDRNTTERQQRSFLRVHTHELSHQWVGNLVTPIWWDDIWLNEAFANWMEQKIAQDYQPAGHFDRAHFRSTLDAMNQDSLPSARRIREPINGNDDIANVFDDITYSKGAGVLSMFEHYVGQEKFRDGVRKYLRSHAFGSASADDFLKSIVEAAAEPAVAGAFGSFLDQTGVPLIDVKLECVPAATLPGWRGGKVDPGSGVAHVRLSQQRYRQLGARPPAQRARWQVPVCVRVPEGRQCKLLDEFSTTMELAACPAWLMPNADGAGYYRFHLDDAATTNLLAHQGSLSELEQMAMADSVLAGFRAGNTDYATVLTMAEGLAQSPIREVVTAPVEIIEIVHERLLDDRARLASALKITEIYGAVLARLDLGQPEQHLLASELTRFIALRGNDAATRERLNSAAMRFLGSANDGEVHGDALDNELLGAALIVAVRERGAPVFDLILAKLPHVDTAVYRDAMVNALGYASDPLLLQRARALLLAGTLRRAEVDALAFALFADDRTAVSWAWLKTNVDALVNAGSVSLATLVPYLATGFCSAPEEKDVRNFLTPRVAKWDGATRALAQTLDSIEFCTALKKAQGDSARRAFAVSK